MGSCAAAAYRIGGDPGRNQGHRREHVNPLGLGVTENDARAATLWRTMDVSFLVPVSGAAEGTVDVGSLDYAGVRVRANFVAPFKVKARTILDAKVRTLETAITARNVQLGGALAAWTDLLEEAPDAAECVRWAKARDFDRAAVPCGRPPGDPAEVVAAFAQTDSLMKQVSELLDCGTAFFEI